MGILKTISSNWQVKLAEWLIVFALLGGGYWWIGHHAVEQHKEEQIIQQAKEDKKQQAKYDKLSSEYELSKTKRQENVRIITKEVEKIVSHPVYLQHCVDDAGLSIINQALSGDTGKFDAALQTTK